MKTRILSLLPLAAALCGCLHENEASVQFYAVCYPPTPTATGCSYPDKCDQVALGTFWADTAVVREAVAPIEIRNQLPDNRDLSSGRLNTNVAYIQQFRMEFVLPGSGATLPEEWVDANVTVPTNGSTVGLVPILPPNIMTILAGTTGHLMVNVRAVGRFADERYFVTGPFKVPVDICTGCSGAIACTAPAVAAACPQLGQYAAQACVTY